MTTKTQPDQTIYWITCPKCDGTGVVHRFHVCDRCDGKGEIKSEK